MYEEARDLLKVKEGDIAKGVPVSPKAGRVRFEDAMARRIDLHLTPASRAVG